LDEKSAAVAAAGLTMVSASAFANADLAKAKNCLACHAVDRSWSVRLSRTVAAKYASDKDAAAKLAKKIREGGVGVWGQVPMPPTRRSTRPKRQPWPNGC